MKGRGAPFRFLGAVSVGWVGARIALLWPQTGSLPEAIKALIPLAPAVAKAAPAAAPAAKVATVASAPHAAPARPIHRATAARDDPAARMTPMPVPDPLKVQMALMGLVQYGLMDSPRALSPAFLPAASAPDRIDPMPDRWSASGWFVARGRGGLGAVPGGGQLGGGQAGLRIAYLLSPRARVAAFARVTAPLAGKGREAAIGLEWQPTRANVRVVAERRFGLDGTPGGTGLGVVAGADESVSGFRLEAYGQAGAIARAQIEPYADGAARLTRRVGGAKSALSLGIGAWGGAQRDAARLDVGPSAILALRPVRVSLDWRQRIAGRARPGSGLALTLGSDF